MKYNPTITPVPTAKRKDYNLKIVRLLESGQSSFISTQDVYDAFTGNGGIHELNRMDYNNYFDYSTAKKDKEQGQFFTPHNVVEFIVKIMSPTTRDIIGDLTCGKGNFFNFAPVEYNCYGNEIDAAAYKVASHLYPDANLERGDIRAYDPKVKMDIIFGNPPFNLRFNYEERKITSQYYYLLKAHELLHPGGFIATIVPASFLNDDFYAGGSIEEINHLYSFVAQYTLPISLFKQYEIDQYEMKLLILQKKSKYLLSKEYSTESVPLKSLSDSQASAIYQEIIHPLQLEKENLRIKLLREDNKTDKNVEFQNQVTKLLYDIHRHPKLSKQHAKCRQLVNSYYEQSKPAAMSYDDWQQKRLTSSQVLRTLKQTLADQHKVEVEQIALVKNKHQVYLKAYSAKTAKLLQAMNSVKAMSFNDMILDGIYPFSDLKYKSLLHKKKNEYIRQSLPLNDVLIPDEISKFFEKFYLVDQQKQKVIRLNEQQKLDTSRMLTKRYGCLSWTQGSGKSLAAIAWNSYLQESNKIAYTIVVAPAMAVNLTWKPILENYQKKFVHITSLTQLDSSIEKGTMLLISYERLNTLKKHIQKFMKLAAFKVAIIADESDEMTNFESKRSQAAMACFRRARFKLLTTGTVTRNNINEFYPQLEFLYNNSINMLCEANTIYKKNQKTEKLESISNSEYYLQPFPPYQKGFNLFRQCFSPRSVTVFGVDQHNQNIYNADLLSKLIDKTVITKSYEEVVGRKNYSFISHEVEQLSYEKQVYEKLMYEFHSLINEFIQEPNERKKSMMRIIRQIQLLIEASSMPHLLGIVTSNQKPNKMNYITSLVAKYDEQVAIGTLTVRAAEEYYIHLQNQFPDRPIFLITGSVNFEKRKEVLADFSNSTSGVLISTQQSLKSSVSVPTCHQIIIESLPWNMSKLTQYAFRFIRYTSSEQKEIHLVVYKQSIEKNLLSLLMSKEKMNQFVKLSTELEEDEIFKEYGLDTNIIQNLIHKEIEDGKVKLNWGNQTFSLSRAE